jgi:hypothetical protein
MPATAPRPYKAPTHRRERRTDGGIPLPRGADGRTVSARRYRQLVESIQADLGGNLSTVDIALVRQGACLTLAAEQIQADVAAGRPIDADALVRVSSEARRILETLRSKATANKPTGPTLADYLAQKQAEKAAEASDGGAA